MNTKETTAETLSKQIDKYIKEITDGTTNHGLKILVPDTIRHFYMLHRIIGNEADDPLDIMRAGRYLYYQIPYSEWHQNTTFRNALMSYFSELENKHKAIITDYAQDTWRYAGIKDDDDNASSFGKINSLLGNFTTNDGKTGLLLPFDRTILVHKLLKEQIGTRGFDSFQKTYHGKQSSFFTTLPEGYPNELYDLEKKVLFCPDKTTNVRHYLLQHLGIWFGILVLIVPAKVDLNVLDTKMALFLPHISNKIYRLVAERRFSTTMGNLWAIDQLSRIAATAGMNRLHITTKRQTIFYVEGEESIEDSETKWSDTECKIAIPLTTGVIDTGFIIDVKSKPFVSAALGHLLLLCENYSSKILAYRKAAIAAILARNFSHVIGSHVLSNPRFAEGLVGHDVISSVRIQLGKWLRMFDQITDEYIEMDYPVSETGGYWSRARNALFDAGNELSQGGALLKNTRRFHHYLQGRFDFIARAIGDFEDRCEPVFFVAELLNSFLAQTTFIDSIVSDLGIRKKNLSFKVKLPHPNNPEDMIEFISIFEEEKTKAGISEGFRWQKCGEVEIEDCDVMVGLPGGMISAHAFYALIENIIRNSIKYNRKEQEYCLHIELKQGRDSENTTYNRSNHYHLTFWDNYSGADTLAVVSKYFKQDVLDNEGRTQTKGLGVQEMKICAENLIAEPLRKQIKECKWESESVDNQKLFKATPFIRPNNNDQDLTYTLDIAKPVLIAIWEKKQKQTGTNEVANNKEEALPSDCTSLIRFSSNIEALVTLGAHILVIDGHKEVNNIAKDIREYTHSLPFRILVVCNNVNATKRWNNIKKLCDRVQVINSRALHDKLTPEFKNKEIAYNFIIECYDAWLREWKSGESWDLWIGFERNAEQVDSTWKYILDEFKKNPVNKEEYLGSDRKPLINIFVKSHEGSDVWASNDTQKKAVFGKKDAEEEYWKRELNEEIDKKRALVFDNHGECFHDASNAERSLDFRKSTRFYQKFGGNTPDLFRTLFNPPSRSLGFAFFIYSLVESCLTNVGIVDERIATDVLDSDIGFAKALSDHQKTGVFPIFRIRQNENNNTYLSENHKIALEIECPTQAKKEGVLLDNESCNLLISQEYGTFDVSSTDINLDVLVVHEGALDLLFSGENSPTTEEKKKFSEALLKIVPSIIRTSGRGRHTRHFDEMLPFIEFNEVSSALLTSRNKYSLVRGLLGTTGTKKEE